MKLELTANAWFDTRVDEHGNITFGCPTTCGSFVVIRVRKKELRFLKDLVKKAGHLLGE